MAAGTVLIHKQAPPQDDHSPSRICALTSYQGDPQPSRRDTLMFAMEARSSVSDLCQQIESTQGAPVRLFRRGPDGTGVEMRGPQPVFDAADDGEFHVPLYEVPQRRLPEFEAKVKTLTSAEFSIKVGAFDTALDLKQRICDSRGIPPHIQRLVFSGFILRDGKQPFQVPRFGKTPRLI